MIAKLFLMALGASAAASNGSSSLGSFFQNLGTGQNVSNIFGSSSSSQNISGATYQGSTTVPTGMFDRIFNVLSQNRPACPSTVNMTGNLDAVAPQSMPPQPYQQQPPAQQQLWICDVPLTTPQALAGCMRSFAQSMAQFIGQQCASRPVCIYPPSGASDSTRIDRLEAAIWSQPYRTNVNSILSGSPNGMLGIDLGSYPPPAPVTPYPGQQASLALISELPCSSYVTDATPLTPLMNLLLKNASMCILDKQLFERASQLLQAVNGLNVQCVAGVASASAGSSMGTSPSTYSLDSGSTGLDSILMM